MHYKMAGVILLSRLTVMHERFRKIDSKYYIPQSVWDKWRRVSHCPTNWCDFLLWFVLVHIRASIKPYLKRVWNICRLLLNSYYFHPCSKDRTFLLNPRGDLCDPPPDRLLFSLSVAYPFLRTRNFFFGEITSWGRNIIFNCFCQNTFYHVLRILARSH